MSVETTPSANPWLQEPAYKVPRHPAQCDLILDGNEGRPPNNLLMNALQSTTAEDIRRYPSTAPLERKIAHVHGILPEQVLVTAGADDGLQRVCRAYLSPKRNLVLPAPSFAMIPRFAQWCNAPIKTVPWDDVDYPLEATLSAINEQTGIVAVVSPNNPTGGVATRTELHALSAAAPHAIIMLDCAYAEFADEDLTEVAISLPNVLVFRTFSKAWGLAGLRVGYVIGHSTHIQQLRQVGLPYPCSAPTLKMADCAVEQPFPSEFVKQVKKERRVLETLLSDTGWKIRPSHGNFVYGEGGDSLWWRDALAGLGIAIRAWPNDRTLGRSIRISCPGDAQENHRLLHAIRTVAEPEAILFDIDGVLIDVRDSYRTAILQTAAHFGHEATHEDIEDIKRKGNANNDWQVTQMLLAEHQFHIDIDAIREIFDGLYYDGLWKKERLIGSIEQLTALATKIPLAAVTGRPRKDYTLAAKHFGFDEIFKGAICMEDAPIKPSPEPVKMALELLGVSRAWMLGDTADDIQAARQASVLPIGIQCMPDKTDHLRMVGASEVWSDWTQIFQKQFER